MFNYNSFNCEISCLSERRVTQNYVSLYIYCRYVPILYNIYIYIHIYYTHWLMIMVSIILSNPTIRSRVNQKICIYIVCTMQFENDCNLVKNWACLKNKFKYKYEQHRITWHAYIPSTYLHTYFAINWHWNLCFTSIIRAIKNCICIYLSEKFYISLGCSFFEIN